MTKRFEALQKYITSKNTLLIISSAVNRRYFTGVKSSAGTLLISQNQAEFIIDSRYHEMAEKCCYAGIAVTKETELNVQISNFIAKNNINKIKLETNILVSVADYFKLKFKDTQVETSVSLNKFIENLRRIKDEEEISNIKKAQSITDAAFTYICSFIKPGITEIDVMIELELFMKRNGASGLAFDSIVVAGTNSSLPHGVPSPNVINDGDMLTMDFGAEYKGYCSDMTRTIAVGYASDEMVNVYNTVLAAQTNAEQAISSGIICKAVDAVARDLITKAGYGDYFDHGTGHSLGLEIHEEPNFNKKCDEVLCSGMVLSVEPGIYLPGKFGVRIEDIILVTDDGCEILTNSPKDLLIIK